VPLPPPSFLHIFLPTQDEDTSLTLPQLLQDPWGVVTVVSELVCLVTMVPFLAIEGRTMTAYGLLGWLNVYNMLDIATYVLQVGAYSSPSALASLDVKVVFECICS
jgi:hypothetical protein